MASTFSVDEKWPGESIGLPESGRGSLASWKTRITAIVVDWAACMIVAVGFFGTGVLLEQTWRKFMIMTVFFLEASILGALAGGSFGQLITRIGIARLDHQPLGFLRAIARTFLLCLGLPALVVGAHRRGLHDLAVGTVVINRK